MSRQIVAAAVFLLVLAAHAHNPAVLKIPFLAPAFVPFRAGAFAAGLAASAGLLLLGAAVVAGWWAWGRVLLRWLWRGRAGWPSELGVGLMAGSLAVAGIGFPGLLFRPVLVLLLAAAVAAACGARAWRGPLARARAAGLSGAWPLLLFLPAVPYILVAPLLPPTDVDILEYHAGLPVLWGMLHRLHNETGNLLFTMPLGFERLSVPFHALGIGGAAAAGSLVLLAASAATVASVAGAWGGWLVLGFGSALLLAWQGHPDTGLVFAAALGVRAAATGSASGIGIACALAAFTKYQGIALAAAIAIPAVRWAHLRPQVGLRARPGPRTRGRRPSGLPAAAVLALLPNLPWLLRNWWLTGNPVYPFLSHAFPSLAWTDWNTQVLWGSMPNASVAIDGVFPEERILQLALAFWDGTGTVWLNPWSVLVYAAPLFLLVRGTPPLARRLAGQALVFGLIWLLPIPKFGRYLVPGLVPAIAAAWIACAGLRPAVWAAALFLAVQALSFVVSARESPVPCEKVLTGAATREEFRRASLGAYADSVDAINASPDGGRTLVVGQGYGVGLARPWLAANETGRPAWLGAAGPVPGPGRMRVAMRQANVTRVLYNPTRAWHRHTYTLGYPLSEEWLAAWAELWRRWAVLERAPERFDWTGGWWTWRIAARPGPPSSPPWLPGAERLYLDPSALRRGEADAGLLALQRRVAGDFGMSWFQRSMLLFHRDHDAARAEREAREALRRGFVAPGAWNALGVYVATQGRRAEAAELFRRALALEPGYTTARNNLAEVEAPAAGGTR